MSTILVISDTQAPAHHPDTIDFLIHLKDKYRPDHVVHIGDECDFRNLSKYAKDPDLCGPLDEVRQGLEFMHDLYDMFPECRVCISNHGARVFNRAFDAGIPVRFLKSYPQFMEAPEGWVWDHEYEIDNIRFFHGEGLSGDGSRLKACTLRQKSVVFGHIHSHAGISWFSTRESLIFGFNVGCLIDTKSPYFSYNKHQLHRPIIGTGVIVDGLPVFEPMLLDSNGRWTGIKKIRKESGEEMEMVLDTLCPFGCVSSITQKRGKTPSGKQRYRCNNCKKWWSY